jgi:hypothetical protein
LAALTGGVAAAAATGGNDESDTAGSADLVAEPIEEVDEFSESAYCAVVAEFGEIDVVTGSDAYRYAEVAPDEIRDEVLVVAREYTDLDEGRDGAYDVAAVEEAFGAITAAEEDLCGSPDDVPEQSTPTTAAPPTTPPPTTATVHASTTTPTSLVDDLQFEVMDYFAVSRADAACIVSWLEDYTNGETAEAADLLYTEMGDDAYLACADIGSESVPEPTSPVIVEEWCDAMETGLTMGDRVQYSVNYWVRYSTGVTDVVGSEFTYDTSLVEMCR